jgi:hypothetical protein
MPKNPSMDARIRWHLQHSRYCGCRPVPKGVEAEIRRRAKAGY